MIGAHYFIETDAVFFDLLRSVVDATVVSIILLNRFTSLNTISDVAFKQKQIERDRNIVVV